MPKPPLPPEVDEFLKEPNPSVIATLQSDGSPNTVATWYIWENGRVLVNMDEGRKRLECDRRRYSAWIEVEAWWGWAVSRPWEPDREPAGATRSRDRDLEASMRPRPGT